jgi:ribosomal protein S6
MTQTLSKKYKATFILDTRGYDAPIENLVDMLKNTVVGVGGEVSEARNLGRIDFSRVVDRNHTGDSYLEIYFSAGVSAPAALNSKLRLEKTVKRLLVESV